MEQQVFVPVPADRLRAALADPAQVARAVPGLQRDPGAEQPIAGRLRLRIGGHTITYRGELRLTARDDGTHTIEGGATEARGTGSVRLTLTLRVTDADGGASLRIEGTATVDGRITELPTDTVESAVTRLLNRFAEKLGAAEAEREPEAGSEPEAGHAEARKSGDGAAQAGKPEAKDAGARDAEAADAAAEDSEADGGAEDEDVSVFETEVPPSSLDPLADDGLTEFAEPPAEAAHARRTMIGRSAEEVDHAPPRGRYAPVPAPQTVAPNSTLRWAAPAAALFVASAIVVGRALRRRR
ncbi:SRPBCC family protein [Streptomyces sp. NPDC018693]|uniref:SRPBCC family protein n=1 Tax=unclassified Streptomyces TaxID=2593676 RepID=UPI0037B15E46